MRRRRDGTKGPAPSDCPVDGKGKQQYSSKAVAENAAKALEWTGRDGLEAYLCKTCQWWHVGRPGRPSRK